MPKNREGTDKKMEKRKWTINRNLLLFFYNLTYIYMKHMNGEGVSAMHIPTDDFFARGVTIVAHYISTDGIGLT